MAALARGRTLDETQAIAPPAPPAPRAPQPLRPATLQMTMYFSPEGILHHTRCRSRLAFRGVRAQIESDFFCLTCHEHVAVPHFAVTQIPVEAPESDRSASCVVRLVPKDVDVEKRSSTA